MEPIPADAERSIRRSRNRKRVLLLLSSLGEAYQGQLSRITGMSHTRLGWLMFGRPPSYRVDLALVPLGLVRVEVTPGGRKFVITNRGRRKARSLTAGLVRRTAKRLPAPRSGDRSPDLGWKVHVTGHLTSQDPYR